MLLRRHMQRMEGLRSVGRWWVGALAAGLLSLAGCGARTGLRTPDVPSNGPTLDVPLVPEEFCVELLPDGGVTTVNLATRPQVSVADVFFVIDRTGSMDQEIDNIKANLAATIVPAIARTIGDVQFGVAIYGDFPVDPYGDPGDVPFTLVSPVDRSVANVQGAVNSIRVSGGGDNPESLVEALFQVASGAGYAPWITPRAGCAAPGRLGYGCLRPNAQPIFIVVADAPSHNGPTAAHAYSIPAFTNPVRCPPSLPTCAATRGPHTYVEAVNALQSVRARVIGINSGSVPFSGRSDLERLAIDTGAITSSGAPLVFDIGADGRELDTRVVTAVETFTRQVRFNASARVVDLDPARPASAYVRAVRPLGAAPMSQIERIEGTQFVGVVPGTELTFGLDLATSMPQPRETLRIPARIQFLADGRPILGSRDIVIVIPGLDGAGCGGGNDAGPSVDDAAM